MFECPQNKSNLVCCKILTVELVLLCWLRFFQIFLTLLSQKITKPITNICENGEKSATPKCWFTPKYWFCTLNVQHNELEG